MRCVVAAFVKDFRRLGRCFVQASYFVSLIVIDVACSTGIVRVCDGVNEVVTIE